MVNTQNSCICTGPNIFLRFWQKSRIYRYYKSIKADLERLDKEIDRSGSDASFVIKGHKEIVAALTNIHSSSSQNIINEQKLRIINKLKYKYTSKYDKIKRLMTNTFVSIDEKNYINDAFV
ncbi:unnamed protein product [Rotaria sp. Silwood1]|nr:unnamed protein product [Rotaria sp. Silwood1]